jgi:hypothetical protein
MLLSLRDESSGQGGGKPAHLAYRKSSSKKSANPGYALAEVLTGI